MTETAKVTVGDVGGGGGNTAIAATATAVAVMVAGSFGIAILLHVHGILFTTLFHKD